ncbi:MauE/DoxX family redox-associated membrane protein [Spirillospora sp. NPDC047279]|uniref:MauE/DoxX family redox-associated membrane protein n=1 Tax=Spirillospora sp. NPDC047279 TaxID=3155478 RepID=UPI003406FE2C
MATYLRFADTVLLAVVFTVAAGSKARSAATFRAFARSLRRLGVPGPRTGTPVAVVAGESVIALLLAWSAAFTLAGADGAWRDVPGSLGLVSAAASLIVFSAGIGAGLRRGGGATCQCFGPSTTVLGVPHIVRNVLLAALAAAGVPVTGGNGHAAGLLIAACAGVAAALLVIASDDIVRLFRADTVSS